MLRWPIISTRCIAYIHTQHTVVLPVSLIDFEGSAGCFEGVAGDFEGGAKDFEGGAGDTAGLTMLCKG